jgi:hypothetical protein
MQADVWGMDHLPTYLRGKPYTLFAYHKPLEKLGKVHTKTLSLLQETMQTYGFEIMYRKGSKMPAYYLSQNIWHLRRLLLHQEIPPDTHQ